MAVNVGLHYISLLYLTPISHSYISLLYLTPISHSYISLLQVVCGTMGMPTATIQMRGPDHVVRMGVGVGTGKGWTRLIVNYKAIRSIMMRRA